jgi:hypothetical protein
LTSFDPPRVQALEKQASRLLLQIVSYAKATLS